MVHRESLKKKAHEAIHIHHKKYDSMIEKISSRYTRKINIKLVFLEELIMYAR